MQNTPVSGKIKQQLSKRVLRKKPEGKDRKMALPVIYQLMTMVILMVIGVILQKKKILSLDNSKGLSIVLTRVAVPCNMVVLLQREYSREIFNGFLVTCGATYLICCIGAAMFFIVGKMLKMKPRELGLFSGGGVYSNVIFMGQPLIMAMYGAEGLIFCVAVMFTCNVFLFTVCSILFGMGGEHRKPALQMLKEAFEKNRAVLQYFQLQTRSHFIINCLKSLNGMAETGDYAKMKRMLIAFSSHLRYIFRDNLELVSLADELDEVNDYYNIILLDRTTPIILNQQIDQALLPYKVPSLIIQTFLENTIKYNKEKVISEQSDKKIKKNKEKYTKGKHPMVPRTVRYLNLTI